MHQVMGQVVRNRELAAGLWHLIVEAPEIAARAEPGQFAMLRVASGLEPLLRRPLSFYRIARHYGWLEFVYKVVGRGTQILTTRAAGDRLDLLGPLGRGWDLLPGTRRIGIVGRGIGIAPLIGLAEAAVRRGIAVEAFLSAREPQALLGLDLLRELGCGLYLHTERGEYSGRCREVTEHLEEAFEEEKPDQLFVCGSRRLGQAVLDFSRRRGVRSQISLEERMACGLGACIGCVTEIRAEDGREYRRVCKEGPVFWVEEVAMLYDR